MLKLLHLITKDGGNFISVSKYTLYIIWFFGTDGIKLRTFYICLKVIKLYDLTVLAVQQKQ